MTSRSEPFERIPPEVGWILLGVRPQTKPPHHQAREKLGRQVRCWRNVLALADANSLTPLLATCHDTGGNHAARGVVFPPAWFQEELKKRRYACLARSVRMMNRLVPVVRDMHAEGVLGMLLKGTWLAETVYPDSGARYFGDIDLLVDPSQVSVADRVLREHAYRVGRPVDFSRPPRIGHYLNSVLYTIERNEVPSVHLHWHPVNSSLPSNQYCYRIVVADIWKAARRHPRRNLPLWGPDPVHLAVTLCEHAFREGFRKLSLLADVAWVCTSPEDPPCFWRSFSETAQAWGLSAPCYGSLRLCAGLGLMDVPQETLGTLRTGTQTPLFEWILKRSLSRPGTQRWGKLQYLAICQGLSEKTRYCFQALCPPARDMEAIYALEPGSIRPWSYVRWVMHRLAEVIRIGAPAVKRLLA